MLKKFFHLFVELTGHPVSSRILQAFTRSRGSAWLNGLFVKTYSINMDEAESDIGTYKSLQALFTRRLKPEARPIDENQTSVVSPVDGVLSAFGKITDTSTFPVKGQIYQISDLLGDKLREANYQGGYYIVIYLSPGHYHRIHSPIKGTIVDQWELGKVSYPVNKLGLKYGDKVYSTNYRLISEMDSLFGKVALVKVGALNVNSIHLTHTSENVQKGEEIGYFSFGSTVILLIENPNFQMYDHVKEDMGVQYGQPIGYFHE